MTAVSFQNHLFNKRINIGCYLAGKKKHPSHPQQNNSNITCIKICMYTYTTYTYSHFFKNHVHTNLYANIFIYIYMYSYYIFTGGCINIYIYIFLSMLVYIFLFYKPSLDSSLEAKVLGKVASLVIEDQVTENVRTSRNFKKKSTLRISDWTRTNGFG